MELTDEQRRRIEENRLKAQAKLRQKRAMQQQGIGARQGLQANQRGLAEQSPLIPPSATPEDSSSRSGVGERYGLHGEEGTSKGSDENKRVKLSEEVTSSSHQSANNSNGGSSNDSSSNGSTKPRKVSSRVGGGGDGPALTGVGGKSFIVTSRQGGGAATSRSSAADGGMNKAGAECEGCAGAEGDARVDRELFEGFGITICRACKLSKEEYQFISKKEAKDTYLLPEGTIGVLKYVEKDNPHHSGWTKMKLYLRRDVMEYSYKRWGSEAGLDAERRRRDELKFDRSLARTKGVFKRATSQDIFGYARGDAEDEG